MAIGGTNEQIPSITSIISGDSGATLLTKYENYAQGIEDNAQIAQDNLENTIDNMFNGGIISGCAVTDSGGLTIDIAAGVLIIHEYVAFSQQTGLSLTNNATNYVWVGQDETVTINTTGVRPTGQAHIKIAKVITLAGSISSISQIAADIDILSLPSTMSIRSSYQVASDSEIDLTDVYGDLVVTFKPLDDITGENFLPDSCIVGSCTYSGTADETDVYDEDYTTSDVFEVDYYPYPETTDKIRVYVAKIYTSGSDYLVDVVLENVPTGWAKIWMRAEKRY